MPVNTTDLLPGGGGGNNPGGLASNTGFGTMSSSTAGSAIFPIYSFSDDSLGFFQSGVSTIAQSYGSFNLNQSRLVSVRTIATSNITAAGGNVQIATDEVGFTVGGASGATLFIKSGGTIYLFNSAASAIA